MTKRMKSTIKYFLFVPIMIAVVLYFYGIRFSPKVLLVKNLTFSEIEHINSSFWKLSGGEFHIGDIITFDDKQAMIKHDTIFIETQAAGRIVEVNKRYFPGDYELVIESLTKHKKAYYVSK